MMISMFHTHMDTCTHMHAHIDTKFIRVKLNISLPCLYALGFKFHCWDLTAIYSQHFLLNYIWPQWDWSIRMQFIHFFNQKTLYSLQKCLQSCDIEELTSTFLCGQTLLFVRHLLSRPALEGGRVRHGPPNFVTPILLLDQHTQIKKSDITLIIQLCSF